MERLACYDERERKEAESAAETRSPTPVDRAQQSSESRAASSPSVLEERWELRRELKRGAFNLVAYRPVYGLVHWTSSTNEFPVSPTRSFDTGGPFEIDNTEVKIQLSFKTKLIQNLLATDGDLWFGYTQVSYWQVANSGNSSPFRETNYEPEAMFVYPLQADLGGLRLRFAAVGLSHQSNGRAEPLSRSWNRLIGSLAAEFGPWSVAIRPWKRVFESDGQDNDNPDIEDFAGRGELIVTNRSRGHVFTLTARHSLRSGARSHGSAQFDWAFPIVGALNGRVQIFSGYGQNLIDYNHRQTTLGLGISFLD